MKRLKGDLVRVTERRAGLYLRRDRNTKPFIGDRIGELAEGDVAVVCEETENDWVGVLCRVGVGIVMNKYLGGTEQA